MRSNKTDETYDQLLEELRALRKSVAELKGERDAVREEVSLADRIRALKEEITAKEIEKARLVEDHERETREVTHMVGLERKRQEFEAEQARKEIEFARTETTLAVREENLSADRARFEDEMKFTRERFEKEIGYLKELMVEVLGRLPTVSVEKAIDLAVNGNGNGKHAEADA